MTLNAQKIKNYFSYIKIILFGRILFLHIDNLVWLYLALSKNPIIFDIFSYICKILINPTIF